MRFGVALGFLSSVVTFSVLALLAWTRPAEGC